MRILRSISLIGAHAVSVLALCSAPARGVQLSIPPAATDILDKIYSFDTDAAISAARNMQQEQPTHPLGYLLEAEAIWWKVWCNSAEFRYGMTDVRHRPKRSDDQVYLKLATKITTLAEEQLRQQETAEMHFYAGIGEALAARLYALRGENRIAARAGVRARAHFLRALQLDPTLADADLGVGLYNYYVDTLSSVARVLRFFMGIPGGSKQEGIRELEHAISKGVLTPNLARFYLAMNLHRYDLQYEKALAVIGPLADAYPSNPLFQLVRGDLYAKLNRKEQALASYRTAASVTVNDAECAAHIKELVHAALRPLGVSDLRMDQ